MGSIYKITNTVNGKSYIGQTRNDAVKTRIRDHLTGNSKGNRILKNAVKKHGREAFTFEILHDGIIPEFLDTLEIETIQKFNTLAPNGYNLDSGGNRNKTRSEETKRRLSKANKGKPGPWKGKTFSEEHRRNLSASHMGKIFSETSRRRMSESRKGKPRSEETKRKLSEINAGENHPQYGKPRSEETKRKLSAVSKGKRRPEYIPARDIFFSLPSDMTLAEKRNVLYKKITGVSRNTLYRWTREWIQDD